MRLPLITTLACALSIAMSLSFSTIVVSAQSNVVVQPVMGPTVAQKVTDQARASWPWYIARASGLVAAAALVVLMLSGIGQITGTTFRFLDPLTAWASHRALGISFGVAVLVHMFTLLFDKFVHFSLLDLFVPWLSSYHPVTFAGHTLGSLPVAFGVLAFYLTALVIITSLLWVEKKPYVWKTLHLLSYITILLVFIHALYIGTDVAHGVLRVVWILLGLVILVSAVLRLGRLHNHE